jgi:hypothetical protein
MDEIHHPIGRLIQGKVTSLYEQSEQNYPIFGTDILFMSELNRKSSDGGALWVDLYKQEFCSFLHIMVIGILYARM